MAGSPLSVEERLAVFENSLNDLTILIRSLLPPVQPGNVDNSLQTVDAPTYATIAAVESEITLNKAELIALTSRDFSSGINRPLSRSNPPTTSTGLTVLPNRTLRLDPTPPPLSFVAADADVTRCNSSGRPA